MARYHIIVLSKPTVGREDEFDRWYTNQHIRDLVKVPGIISARRFKLVERHTQGVPQQYVAEYEVETDDIDATMAAVQQRLGTDEMPMTDAFDMGSAAFLVAEAITEKLSAAS
ncbi:DUF4286 family protein [uncultured Phenylobacterium sp.]|uniref:DUF4286 family protein n=1 Tax=uncultured Phenylobacterium sp. TaxID=349273 RepID=UPI0025F29955|nr:DUF4286 family protein [uncultured Phenylobacterium sp.]